MVRQVLSNANQDIIYKTLYIATCYVKPHSKNIAMQAWKDYQNANKDRFLEELLELLRIPSVSARSEHKDDMLRCAEAVKQRMRNQCR